MDVCFFLIPSKKKRKTPDSVGGGGEALGGDMVVIGPVCLWWAVGIVRTTCLQAHHTNSCLCLHFAHMCPTLRDMSPSGRSHTRTNCRGSKPSHVLFFHDGKFPAQKPMTRSLPVHTYPGSHCSQEGKYLPTSVFAQAPPLKKATTTSSLIYGPGLLFPAF